ncbi:DUF1203 domain-containing protein [Pseudohalocynthiibacter aestuariivivens]|nr:MULTISPECIES: DUF1203 domain-containing protein [Pseudohalocynthiibacter]MBS9716649.1 DUF1203 domain-containing protein [Pseudohalocynthiibacter aestuariivivens]MCK0101731.1 DUF1203 domain-containing protein [Pseudohalocynthiibacter sp. F2068]
MMPLTYQPYDSDWVAAIRSGAPDANGQPAERSISDGGGNPCRHCLDEIPKGAPMLICAARPFPELQPYAEAGPIFLCADACVAYSGTSQPPVLKNRSECLLKAYGSNNRIIYGSGRITPTSEVESYCETLFSDEKVAYVDVRSATNNCFTFRITRRNDPSSR